MNTRTAIMIAIFPLIGACAADSIDSSPVPTPPNRRASLPEPARGSAATAWSNSNEYRANHGLAGIGAAEAYAARPAGRPGGAGQVIAVIDTGIDTRHPDLNMLNNGSFVRDTSIADRAHGTHVAGIAAARRDGVGMHGVAYNAQINGIDVFSRNGPSGLAPVTAADEIAAAIGSAGGVRRIYGRPTTAIIGGVESDPRLRSDVANLSIIIPGTTAGDPTVAAIRAGMADATAAGTLVVAALGNDRLAGASGAPAALVDDPALRGRAVAVGNWDTTRNSIADVAAGRATGRIEGSTSNGCGRLRNCLFAPGTSIVSTVPGGGYGAISGTSMAAPHVAGALAVMKAAFPNVPPETLLQRLFRTAINPLTGRRNDFDPNSGYGWGLMDLGEAMRQQGALQVVTPSGQVALASTSLQLGAGFSADALADAFETVVALDADGFAFRTGLADQVRNTRNKSTFLDGLVGRTEPSIWSGRVGPVAMTASLAADADNDRNGASRLPEGNTGFMLRLALTPETDFTLGTGRNRPGLIEEAFGRSGGALFADIDLTSPFQNFARDSYSAEMRTTLGDDTTVALNAYLPLGDGDATVRGFGVGARHRLTERLSLIGQTGFLSERSSLWGGTGSGGLSLDAGETRHVALGADLAVTDRLSVSMVYNYGVVDPKVGGLLTARGKFSGDAYAFGATLRDALFTGDQLSLTAGLPFRVNAAPVTISAGTGFDDNGALIMEQRRVDLAPDGREMRIGLSYGLQLPDLGVATDIGAMLRVEPDHRSDADPEVIVGGGLQWQF